MKAVLAAIESGMKISPLFEYLNGQIVCAVNGVLPVGWTGHAIVISPVKQTPIAYPSNISNHTALTVMVYCYTEYFGERVGLMGDSTFPGVLDMEQHVREFLTPDGNMDFHAFNGLVSACFWQNTGYPEARLRTYQAFNEARVLFEYRN